MLEIDDLTVRFPRVEGLWHRRETTVLEGVTLAVRAGELLALTGSSGAGKTLLAHAVLGILPRHAKVEGRIRFEGRRLDAERLRRLRGRRIALVPQSIAHLDPLARVADQVRWAARRAGLPRAGLASTAAASLGRVGLGPYVARAFPHAVSGGMARRVLMATALAGHADLVLVDEPTDGLDPAAAATVLRHLRALADRGAAVVAITHDLPCVLPHADRVAVMRDGTLAAIERAADFAADGSRLGSPFARGLWRALPANGFVRPDRPSDA